MSACSIFRAGRSIARWELPFREIVKWIQLGKPVRIFAESLSPELTQRVLSSIPLWSDLPYAARNWPKLVFFFAGPGTSTSLHYDRELNCNLHLALHGSKRILLFKYDDSENLYKTPLVSNSLIRFSDDLDSRAAGFPRLHNATCYDVDLKPGEMLYMPKRCWHYIEYAEPSASATFGYYPRKPDQLLGRASGLFYLGFTEHMLRWNHSHIYRRFASAYAHATGTKKVLLVAMEKAAFIALFPLCAFGFLVYQAFRR